MTTRYLNIYHLISIPLPPHTETGLHPQVNGEGKELKAMIFDINTDDVVTEVDMRLTFEIEEADDEVS